MNDPLDHPASTSSDLPQVIFGDEPVGLSDVLALATGRARAVLCKDKGFCEAIEAGAALLDRILAEEGAIYGVTTGYGDSCDTAIAPEQGP